MSSGSIGEVLARVESELTALWSLPDDATGMTKVRASTLNLVVVTTQDGLPAAREATDDLASTHAGRVILLAVDPRLEPWAIEHEVSGVCRPMHGSEPICNDRIELRLGAMVAPRIPSVVQTLALSEVPLVAEIALNAPRTVTDALVPICHRVIVDSAHTHLRRIAEILWLTRAPIADRAFVRTFTWRELVARFFDDASEALGQVRHMSVSRTAPYGVSDPGPLLIGWLASRLGWHVEEGRLRDGRGEFLEVGMRVENRTDLEAGQLTQVLIETREGGAAMDLAIQRTSNPRVLRWSRSGARKEVHEHALGHRDETWVLGKALDMTVGDQSYRQAVEAALPFVEDGG